MPNSKNNFLTQYNIYFRNFDVNYKKIFLSLTAAFIFLTIDKVLCPGGVFTA